MASVSATAVSSRYWAACAGRVCQAVDGRVSTSRLKRCGAVTADHSRVPVPMDAPMKSIGSPGLKVSTNASRSLARLDHT